MGFIGMILVYQAGLQTEARHPRLLACSARPTSSSSCAISPRRIGALMLATRVGAGIAAEIGSMVVTEQVDALRMCAADPIDYLDQAALPREHRHDDRAHHLGRLRRVRRRACSPRYVVVRRQPADLLQHRASSTSATSSSGSTKCVAYGAAIPIVSGHCGLVDVRRLRGRRLGDDARGRELVARGHHPELRHQHGGLRPPRLSVATAQRVAGGCRCPAALASTMRNSNRPGPARDGLPSPARREPLRSARRRRLSQAARWRPDSGCTFRLRDRTSPAPAPPCSTPRGTPSRCGKHRDRRRAGIGELHLVAPAVAAGVPRRRALAGVLRVARVEEPVRRRRLVLARWVLDARGTSLVRRGRPACSSPAGADPRRNIRASD